MSDITDKLDAVTDAASFLTFVTALLADRQQQEANSGAQANATSEWANNSIASFLEGALSWAEDTDFGTTQDDEIANNPWQQFAVFLYCGKIYE
ncbi:hypothetical protein L9G15_09295 [Shewanella sp. A3A]|nr:hypothetical protein [Shewanella ferrihydritica]